MYPAAKLGLCPEYTEGMRSIEELQSNVNHHLNNPLMTGTACFQLVFEVNPPLWEFMVEREASPSSSIHLAMVRTFGIDVRSPSGTSLHRLPCVPNVLAQAADNGCSTVARIRQNG